MVTNQFLGGIPLSILSENIPSYDASKLRWESLVDCGEWRFLKLGGISGTMYQLIL